VDIDEAGEGTLRVRKTPWEIQELAATAVLAAVAILAVAGIGSAWADTLQLRGSATMLRVGEFLEGALNWAGVFPSVLLLMATGLIWWQVDGWLERLSQLDAADSADDHALLPDFEEAIGHVTRNKMLLSWLLVLAVLTLLASVGAVIGYVIVQVTPNLELSWANVIRASGESLAALVLLAVVGNAFIKLRASCISALRIDVDSESDE
jgi:hypothetical protein